MAPGLFPPTTGDEPEEARQVHGGAGRGGRLDVIDGDVLGGLSRTGIAETSRA
jgi:hypothetical protein